MKFHITITAETEVENRTDQPYHLKLKFATSALDSLQRVIPNENIFYSPHRVYGDLLTKVLRCCWRNRKRAQAWDSIGPRKKMMLRIVINRKKRIEPQLQNQSNEFTLADKLYVWSTISNSGKSIAL